MLSKQYKQSILGQFVGGEVGSRPLDQSLLVFIIGATGCGKTKLSIELAHKLNGEIINADSMQIYQGLDIATNKATCEEMQNVPHHLMSFVDPFTQYTVVDFQKAALQAVSLYFGNKIQ